MADAQRAEFLRTSFGTSFASLRSAAAASILPHEAIGPLTLAVLLEGCKTYHQPQHACTWAARACPMALGEAHGNRLRLLQTCAAAGQTSLATRYFHEWYGHDRLWPEPAASEVVRAHAVGGDFEAAVLMLSRLRATNHGRIVTLAPYSACLQGAKEGSHATRVLFQYYADGHRDSAALLSDYLAAVVRSGSPSEAIAMFQSLRSEGVASVRHPDVYVVLLGACARGLLAKEAVSVFGMMIQDNIKPTPTCVVLLMQAHRGRHQRVADIYYAALRTQGVAPTTAMCHLAAEAAAALPDADLAAAVVRAGVVVSPVTETELALCYLRTGMGGPATKSLLPPSILRRVIARRYTGYTVDALQRLVTHCSAGPLSATLTPREACDIIHSVVRSPWDAFPESDTVFHHALHTICNAASPGRRIVCEPKGPVVIFDAESGGGDMPTCPALVPADLLVASLPIHIDTLCPLCCATARVYTGGAVGLSSAAIVAQYLSRHHHCSVVLWTVPGSDAAAGVRGMSGVTVTSAAGERTQRAAAALRSLSSATVHPTSPAPTALRRSHHNVVATTPPERTVGKWSGLKCYPSGRNNA